MKSLIKILLLNILFATAALSQEDEYGIASFYSDLFHGKPTASGELYDKSKLTAAHKTLPFGTYIRVTRMDNNKSVVVKVNDRGPFISGRVVEISREGARQIGLDADGSARVKVEVVNEKSSPADALANAGDKPKPYEEATPAVQPAEKPADKPAEKTTDKAVEKTADKPTEKTDKKKEDAAAKPEAKTSKNLAVNEKPAAPAKTADKGTAEPAKTTPADKNASPTVAKAVKVLAQDYQPFDLYQIELKRPEKKGFGVQVAALSSQDALFKKIAELQGEWFDNILVSVEKAGANDMLYKVILGTFATQGEADIYKSNLKKNKKLDGFVVDLSSWNKDSSK